MTYEYKVGEWYKTRGGHEAILHDVNFKGQGGLTLLGKVKLDSYEMACNWTKDGRYSIHAPTDFDLLPPVERKEFWVNVYKTRPGSSAWLSKENADICRARGGGIGLIRITIEGDDFTVEKVRK
jgi:hypothetical protein